MQLRDSRVQLWPLSFLILVAVVPNLRAQSALHIDIADDSGKALEEATVYYNRLPDFQKAADGRFELAPSEAVVNKRSVSGAGGAVVIRDLPTGRYHLCIEASGYLDPCKWGASPVVTLSEENPDAYESINLRLGAHVEVRIDDQQGLLSRQIDPVAGTPGLIVGVRILDGDDPGAYRFHQASPVTIDDEGITYGATVPIDTPLYLWVYTREFIIRDEEGNDVPMKGLALPFESEGAEVPRVFRFDLAGRLQPIP